VEDREGEADGDDLMEHLRSMWKQARGGTVLYRGMSIDVPVDAVAREGARAAVDAVLRAAQDPPRDRTGIGVHWTESLDTAQRFAWQIGYNNYLAVHFPYEGRRGKFSFIMPVVLIGRPDFGGVRTDDKVRTDYRMTGIDQIDPDYGTSVYEAEIPIARGTMISVDKIMVAMPTDSIVKRYAELPENKRPTFDDVVPEDLRSHWSWVTVSAPLRVKAARD
jgi:hypothetical protein